MNPDPASPVGSSSLPNLQGSKHGSFPCAPAPRASSGTAPPPTQAALADQDAAVRRAVAESNAKLESSSLGLRFHFNLDAKGSLRDVQLLDSATGQLVMQYPSEAMLAIRDQLDRTITQIHNGAPASGILFSRRA